MSVLAVNNKAHSTKSMILLMNLLYKCILYVSPEVLSRVHRNKLKITPYVLGTKNKVVVEGFLVR